MTSEPLNILLIGSGAVGAFYASRLQSHARVSVVCRSNYQTVKDQKGFHIVSRDFGNYFFEPFCIFPSIQDAFQSKNSNVLSNHASSNKVLSNNASANLDSSNNDSLNTFDYVLIATKAITDFSMEIPTSFRGCFVLIQNGIDIEQNWANRFPNNCILSGVTAISSAQTDLGTITQYRWTRLQLGPCVTRVDEKTGMQKATALKDIFELGGIKDVFVLDAETIQMARWHKLAINAAFSPSAVLCGFGNAEMASHPLMRDHIALCMNEIFETARILFGKDFPSSFASIEAILESTKRNVGAKPSMLLDYEQNKPLELEAILGNAIRVAHRGQITMPRLESMYALISMLLKKPKL